MLVVCVFMCLTKRNATLPWKIGIWLSKISKSQLIRLFLQLQGHVMQYNGVSVDQNRKLEMHYYISCHGARQLPACNGKKNKHNSPKREGPLILPFYTSPENHFALCAPHRSASQTTHPSVPRQEPRGPRSRRGWN